MSPLEGLLLWLDNIDVANSNRSPVISRVLPSNATRFLLPPGG